MKYFKEIEDDYLNKPYAVYSWKKNHVITSFIPYEFYIKYKSVFTRINELYYHLDLAGIRERQKEIERIRDDEELDDRRHKLENEVSGIEKRLLYTYGDVHDYMKEMSLCVFFNDYADNLDKIEFVDCDYDKIKNTLMFYRDLLELVNVSQDNLLRDINNAIDELSKLRTTINYIDRTETYSLPDCWYILPSYKELPDCLYNTTGRYGHKDTNLIYLLDTIFYSKTKYYHAQADEWFNDVLELKKRDFVTYNEYDIVKLLRDCFHNRILDSTGLPYGLREEFLSMRKTHIIYMFETFLEQYVPKEKKLEYYQEFDEKHQYFDLLDSNGLPMGVLDLIKKILNYADESTFLHENPFDLRRKAKLLEEYANNPFATKLIRESSVVTWTYSLLCSIENEINDLLDEDPMKYEYARRYIYSPRAKDLVMGVYMAHGLVTKFIADLYQKTSNPREWIDYLKKMDCDDFLVKCCGFNKVVRQMNDSDRYSEILTSNYNYEEEFKEYIDHGWKVKFIPPIRIDEYNKTLREMDDYCKVKRFHVKD